MPVGNARRREGGAWRWAALGWVIGAMLPVDGWARDRAWIVDHWDQEDGLPLLHLNDIAIDPHGQVWIATFDGLVLFDGVQFTTLRAEDEGGPFSSRVMFVQAHPVDGALWLMLEGGVVERRKESEITVFSEKRLASGTELSPSSDAIWWSNYLGVVKATHTAIPVAPPPGVGVGMVMGDRGSGVWLLDLEQGLWHADSDTTPWTRVTDAENSVGHIFRDPIGEAVALMRESGIVHWREGTQEWVSAPSSVHRSASSPPDDIGWARLDGQVYWQDQLVLQVSANVTQMEVDGLDHWIVTAGMGLYRIRPAMLQVHRAPDDLATNLQRFWWDSVSQILWAHGEKQGWWPIARYGDSQPMWPAPPASVVNAPPYIVQQWTAPDGTPWIADNVHLYAYDAQLGWQDRSPGRLVLPGPVGFSQRGMWMALQHGPFSFFRDEQWHQLEAGDDGLFNVLSVVELRDGTMLLGGQEGLWVLSPDQNKAVPYSDAWTLGAIRNVRQAGDRLWLSTVDHGLCTLLLSAPRTTSPSCLGIGSTLNRGTIHTSLDDGQGFVWVSSNQGIGRVRGDFLADWADGGPQPPVVWFDTSDGMRSAEGNGFLGQAAVQTPDGHLWFATQDGAIEIDPTEIILPSSVDVKFIESRVGDERQWYPTSLSLSLEHPPLTVSWSSAAHGWADQVEFRYRVREDGPWSPPTKIRSVALASIPPGDTSLQIQARLGGDWGPIVRLPLYRAPALHERGYFPLLLTMGVAFVVVGVVVARSRVLTRLNQRLAQQVTEQTREITNQAEMLALQNAKLAATIGALGDANQALEDRAVELAQQNVRIAEQARRLTELDALKRQLLANVSHELRTPLSLIMAPLGALLAESAPGSRARRHLQLASDSTRRLDQLIGQLFDLSRLQAGGLHLQVQKLDLLGLLSDVRHRFEAMAEEASATLVVECDEPEVRIWFEQDLMDKVVTNLVSNALRHSPPGGQVTLALERRGQIVRVWVRDQGPGVPVLQRSSVFERFVQLDAIGGTKKGGTGLGLALVKELVELHGGEVGVEDGHPGAHFWFALPLGVAHFQPDEIHTGDDSRFASSAAIPEDHETTVATGCKVLLVEDHPELRGYLAEVLGERFSVTPAASGAEALDLFAHNAFHLLITDIMMPGVNGIELVRRIREGTHNADIPVLFVSARGELHHRVEGLGLADDYLPKPFYAPELVARAVALLRRSFQAARPAGACVPAPEPATTPEHAELEARLREVALPHLADAAFGVKEFARLLGMSARALQLKMADLSMPPPVEWLRGARIEMGHALLTAGTVTTVAEAAERVGMSRPYFTRVYTSHYGVGPGEERRRVRE